jgi:hypothetical protein
LTPFSLNMYLDKLENVFCVYWQAREGSWTFRASILFRLTAHVLSHTVVPHLLVYTLRSLFSILLSL